MAVLSRKQVESAYVIEQPGGWLLDVDGNSLVETCLHYMDAAEKAEEALREALEKLEQAHAEIVLKQIEQLPIDEPNLNVEAPQTQKKQGGTV